MARLPLLSMFDATAHDVHPPLYYTLLHVWRLLTGDSEFALRALSVLAGTLLLPVAYRLVRALAGAPAALSVVLLLSLSRVLIWYSQEIRFYSLAPLLALASLALAHRLWRAGGWRNWLGYIAVTAAGLLTLYLFNGVLIAENLAFLFAWWRARAETTGARRSLMLPWLAAQAVILASFIPWALYYLPRAPQRFTPAAPLDAWSVAKLYLNTLFSGDANNIDRDWPVMLLGGAVLLGGWLLIWRGQSLRSSAQVFGLAMLLGGVAVPLGAVWLLNLPWSFQLTFTPTSRYFVTQIPWAVILLGIALTALTRRRPRVGFIAGGLIVLAFGISTAGYYSDRYLSDDYKSIARTLAAYRMPEDTVVLHNDRDWPIVAYHIGAGWVGINSGQAISSDQQAAAYLQPAWETHAGAWLLLTPESLVNDPDHRIFNWLATRAQAMREFDADPAARLFFFARTESRAATIDQLASASWPHPERSGTLPSTSCGKAPHSAQDACRAVEGETLSLSPAPGLTLTQANWALPEYRVGETLHLFLYWRNANAPGVYSFALHLTTPQGQLAEEIPATLEVTAKSPAMLRQQVDVPLRAYLGPGQYHLNLIAGQTWADLGSLTLIPAQPHSPVEGSPAHPIAAHFEAGIELQGYTIVPSGGDVNLTLYWTTSAPIDRRYKMFAHLLGPAVNPSTGNSVWAQEDREPNLGGAPVTSWKIGETVMDVIQLHRPANAPAGEYTLEIGWYDFFTGDRLLALDDSGAAVDSRAVLGPFWLERHP